MMKNTSNTPKVEWAHECFSWHFADHNDVSIKMEEICPGGSSDAHFHSRSLQFFFILEGEATVKLEGARFELKKHEGIEVPLNQKHRIINSGDENLVFLLISSPAIQKQDIQV